MQRNFKLKAGDDLGTLASKHFAGFTVATSLPDAGTSQEETIQALLATAGGDHKNLRNIYIGGGYALAVQKNVKAKAKEIAPKVEAGEITLEVAQQILRDTAAEVPQVTIKGEGAGTRKPSTATVEKARKQVHDEAATALAALPDKERAEAEAVLRKLGMVPAAAPAAAPSAKPNGSTKGKTR